MLAVSGGVVAVGGPGEQRFVGRGQAVPVLLDILDRHLERLREGDLGEPAGNADAHRPGGELEQGIAARGVEPVHQQRQLGEHRLAGHRREQRHHLAHRGRVGRVVRSWATAGSRFRRYRRRSRGSASTAPDRSGPSASCGSPPTSPPGNRARRSAPRAPSRDRDRGFRAGIRRSAAASRCGCGYRPARRSGRRIFPFSAGSCFALQSAPTHPGARMRERNPYS